MRYIVNSFEFKKRFLDKFIQLVKQLDFEKNYRVDIKWGGLDSSTDVCDVYYKEQKIFTVSKYMSQNIDKNLSGGGKNQFRVERLEYRVTMGCALGERRVAA